MKHQATIVSVLGLTALVLGGCSARQTGLTTRATAPAPATQTVALTQLGPERSSQTSARPMAFRLGAGDALGQALFTNYAAIVRANAQWQIAGAEEID